MAEYMERVSRKAMNKSKEDLGIPFGSGAVKEKKKKDKSKKELDQDDPMAEEKSEESGSENGSASEDNSDKDEVNFEQKVQFTEKVRRLTNDGLTKLVKNVKSLCPDALEDVDDEKLHI